MHHFFDAITDTKGNALTGYYVRVSDGDGNVQPLYADANLTPIVSVSGVADAAKVDANGNVEFYISVGTYTIYIYATDGTTLVKLIPDVAMNVDIDTDPADVQTVATNIAAVNTAATNIAAIIDAPTQATNAANSASAASTSATNASNSAAAASNSAASAAAAVVSATVNAAATTTLIDALPTSEQIAVRDKSQAPLLVGFANGFALDARQATSAYSYLAAKSKASGAVTPQTLDSILTNGGSTPVRIIDENGNEKYAPHNLFGLSAAPVTRTITVTSGRKYTVVTTGDITLTASNAATGVASSGSPLQITAASTSLILTKGGTSGTAQVYEGWGSVDYIETTTTSARYGVPISKDPATGEMGILVEPPRTNFLLNSYTPATQTVSLAAGTYTLSCKGSGSVALSGGPTGTATDGSPVSFTLGATTSVTFTITGTLTWFQCENGANATSPIVTEGAARGRSLQAIAVATSAIPALGSEWLTFFECRMYGAPSASTYLFGVDDGTASNYFRLRSDGVVAEALAGVTQLTATMPKVPSSGALFNFTLRAKANAILLCSQGNPAGTAGTLIKNIFAPTRATLGNWSGSQAPPGQLYIRRFALLPTP